MKKDNQDSNKVFPGQRDGESFLFMFRRHIIAMRKGFYSFLIIFALSCLPTFIFMTMDMLWIAAAGFIVGLVVFFYHFIMWYFTIYIVTDQRLRQITRKGMFGKNVIDISLNKIQSISYVIPGMAGEIFKFGTINIQTIVGDLTITNTENPDKVYDDLENALEIAEKREVHDGEDII